MSTTSIQKSGCGCGCSGSGGCGGSPGAPAAGTTAGALERPRYYARQLVTPQIMTLGDDYFRARLRRHNRYLHGWGVVCGALVCVVPVREPNGAGSNESWVVQVRPGFLITPTGDEVEICAATTVSLRAGLSASAPSGDDWSDPWCTEVYTDQPEGPVYVAVRYHESQVMPVHAQPGGCGCGELSCEYSRFQDGFEIGILATCPDAAEPADPAGNPVCPAGAPSPWVVLAEVEVDADGTITKIDNCACRRILEPAGWHRCDGTDENYSGKDHPGGEADHEAAETAETADTAEKPPAAKKAAPRSRARKRTGT